MKVRIIELDKNDYSNDDYYREVLVLKDITDWWEVTDKEYKLLELFCRDSTCHSHYYRLVSLPDLTLPQCLAAATALQLKRNQEEQDRKEEAEKKRLAKEKKQKEKSLQEKKKMLAKLKEELEGK